jgi:hypothetical protein
MIDRRSSTNRHPDLSGTDYALEGVTVRDRFLTAFVLQHSGSFKSEWPQTGTSLLCSAFPGGQEESFTIPIENTFEPLRSIDSVFEPLTVRVIDGWLGADDDDEM